MCPTAIHAGQATTAARLANPGKADSHTPAGGVTCEPSHASGHVATATRKVIAAVAASHRVPAACRRAATIPRASPGPKTRTTIVGVHHDAMRGAKPAMSPDSSTRYPR